MTIKPPVRLDPFRRIVNVHFGTVYSFTLHAEAHTEGVNDYCGYFTIFESGIGDVTYGSVDNLKGVSGVTGMLTDFQPGGNLLYVSVDQPNPPFTVHIPTYGDFNTDDCVPGQIAWAVSTPLGPGDYDVTITVNP